MLLTYLVHDTVWPPPRPPCEKLPRPAGAEYAGTPWVSFALDPAELATKRAALAAHRSQWPIIGGLLERFLRRNEIFAIAPSPGDYPLLKWWLGTSMALRSSGATPTSISTAASQSGGRTPGPARSPVSFGLSA